MDGLYLGDWDGTTKQDVADSFQTELADDIEIAIAVYTYEDYSGDAFVLFRQGDKWFEVNGSHCSCMGLEDQWRPEEVVFAELIKRPAIVSTYGAMGRFAGPIGIHLGRIAEQAGL